MNAEALDRLWAEDADEPQWITVNGAHIPLNTEGEPKGKVGEKIREAGASAPFGEAFPEYSGKPAEAIEHLLKEKRGYVPGAFHKEGLGDIDLPYGKGGERGFGLAHIIEQRNAQGVDGVAFARGLPKLIAEGKVERRPDYPGRAYIVHPSGEAAVRLDWDRKERNWIVSAYPLSKKIASGARDGLRTCVPAYDDKQSFPLPYPGGINSLLGSGRGSRSTRTCASEKTPSGDSGKLVRKVYPASAQNTTEKEKPMPDKLILDAAPSRRHRDENGFLHVDACHITREQVAPYYGHEVPGWEALGLDPERLYHVYRPAGELEKAAPTINGLPILWGHSPESADAPQLDRRIGSMGTDASFNAPYLDNSLIFTVKEAIDAIEEGSERELSLSYRYDPDMTPGTFEGQPYDFVMRNLRGNHLALVAAGRAGASCCVADAAPDAKEGEGWITTENGKRIHYDLFLDGSREVRKKKPPARNPEQIQGASGAQPPASGVEQNPRLAGDSAGNPAGEINIRIKPVPVNDRQAAKPQTRKGGLMGTLKKLFGASDAEPETPATPEGQAPQPAPDDKPAAPEDGDKPFSMDDGMKAAMDKCGLDAGDPAVQAAFAEGVKYGEKLMRDPGEREKLDREHEARGMKKAEDGEESPASPDAPKAVDEEKVAQTASDAALARFQSILDAQAEVRPHVGEMRVNLARDSAASIYGAALDALGIDRKDTPASAWRGMFKTAVSLRENRAPAMAQDAAPARGPLAGLNNIASL